MFKPAILPILSTSSSIIEKYQPFKKEGKVSQKAISFFTEVKLADEVCTKEVNRASSPCFRTVSGTESTYGCS